MTASTSAEASDDAARPLTDEELGAQLRRLQAAQAANFATLREVVARRDEISDEIQRLHDERRRLDVEVGALVFGEKEADRMAFNLSVAR